MLDKYRQVKYYNRLKIWKVIMITGGRKSNSFTFINSILIKTMISKGYNVSQKRYTLEQAKSLICPLLKSGVRIKLDDLAAGYSEDDSDLITCRICTEAGEDYKELLDSLSPEMLLLLVKI